MVHMPTTSLHRRDTIELLRDLNALFHELPFKSSNSETHIRSLYCNVYSIHFAQYLISLLTRLAEN